MHACPQMWTKEKEEFPAIGMDSVELALIFLHFLIFCDMCLKSFSGWFP